MCARHVYARWGKRHAGKEIQLQFWNTARSTNKVDMLMHLDRMRGLKKGTSVVEDLLENWPIEGWCCAFFNDVVKCEVIDNNMCETFNGVILEARHKAIITMLEDIRQYCMTRIVVKRENTAKWKSSCGPRICARIEKEREKSGKWQVEWSGGAKHEVFWDNLFFHAREGYVVLLENHNCSCRKWDKTGIPCQHALAALAFQGLDPLEYIAHWFKKETYLKAYQFPVNPLRGRAFWATSEEGPLLPPIVKKMPRRPATKRRREPMEPRNKSKTNISREGRVMTCSICHTKGHNKARCAQRTNVVSLLLIAY